MEPVLWLVKFSAPSLTNPTPFNDLPAHEYQYPGTAACHYCYAVGAVGVVHISD